jgi:hypothetical protein
MVSRRERQLLREIELSLAKSDPDFAALMGNGLAPYGRRRSRRYQFAVVAGVVGIFIALLGLLLAEALLVIGGTCVAVNGFMRVLVLRWAGDD